MIPGLLDKQPDRRYGSGAGLIAALDEAAHGVGAAGASAPHLIATAGYLPRQPAGVDRALPTTLAGRRRDVDVDRAAKRSRGIWLGAGAIVVVTGAIAAVVAAGHRATAAPGDAGVVIAEVADAAPRASARPTPRRPRRRPLPDAAPPPDAARVWRSMRRPPPTRRRRRTARGCGLMRESR